MRVRFFLVAAKSGYPLPVLPQPSHSFPVTRKLEIKLPLGYAIRPIRSTGGTAPQPFVSIADAISDLPRFNWSIGDTGSTEPEADSTPSQVPSFICDKTLGPHWHCGYQGQTPYFHEPETSYQLQARIRSTDDLQQYTRCFQKKKVERCVDIWTLSIGY